MQVILIVRDGWGYTEETNGNAVYLAETPNDDRYMQDYPWTLLKCTGNAIGVPEGTQGGSEPGHLTMGAGRIVWQPLEEINKSIDDLLVFDVEVLPELLLFVLTGGRLAQLPEQLRIFFGEETVLECLGLCLQTFDVFGAFHGCRLLRRWV